MSARLKSPVRESFANCVQSLKVQRLLFAPPVFRLNPVVTNRYSGSKQLYSVATCNVDGFEPSLRLALNSKAQQLFEKKHSSPPFYRIQIKEIVAVYCKEYMKTQIQSVGKTHSS